VETHIPTRSRRQGNAEDVTDSQESLIADNLTGNAMRPTKLGPKNSLFIGRETSGR